MWILVLQRISYDFLIHILYFPVWWYTVGLKRAVLFLWKLVAQGNARLAPGLWLKNIFVPMYGQRDIQGRIASFFIRSVNVVFRAIVLIMWIALCLGLLALWCIIPAYIVYMFFASFSVR